MEKVVFVQSLEDLIEQGLQTCFQIILTTATGYCYFLTAEKNCFMYIKNSTVSHQPQANCHVKCAQRTSEFQISDPQVPLFFNIFFKLNLVPVMKRTVSPESENKNKI